MNTAPDFLGLPQSRLAVRLTTEKHDAKVNQRSGRDTVKCTLSRTLSPVKNKSAISLTVGEVALAGNTTRVIPLFARPDQ